MRGMMIILTNDEIKKQFDDWAKGKYSEREKDFMNLFPHDPEMADRAVAFRAGLIIGRVEKINNNL